MKLWIRRLAWGALGATLVTGSLIGCTSNRHARAGDSEAFQARIVERAGRKLDLDAAQKQKLEALAAAVRTQRDALRGGTDPRAEMRAMVAGAKLDQAAATRMVQQKTEALRAGSPAVIAAAADFFDHLRPEQQQQVREMMERGGRHGRHRRGHGG